VAFFICSCLSPGGVFGSFAANKKQEQIKKATNKNFKFIYRLEYSTNFIATFCLFSRVPMAAAI
jgi:hypothetical protein